MDKEKIGRAIIEITYICDDFNFSGEEINDLAKAFYDVVINKVK